MPTYEPESERLDRKGESRSKVLDRVKAVVAHVRSRLSGE